MPTARLQTPTPASCRCRLCLLYTSARDSLTEKGWREAELLSRRLCKIPDASYYTSPLGRARATASLTMQAVGKEVEVCPWLREFDAGYKTRPDFHPTGHG